MDTNRGKVAFCQYDLSQIQMKFGQLLTHTTYPCQRVSDLEDDPAGVSRKVSDGGLLHNIILSKPVSG